MICPISASYIGGLTERAHPASDQHPYDERTRILFFEVSQPAGTVRDHTEASRSIPIPQGRESEAGKLAEIVQRDVLSAPRRRI